MTVICMLVWVRIAIYSLITILGYQRRNWVVVLFGLVSVRQAVDIIFPGGPTDQFAGIIYAPLFIYFCVKLLEKDK